MSNETTIYFDLDGTVYDLYGQADWLKKLQAEDVSAYASDDALMYDADRLATILDTLVAKGYSIGVITWLAMNASAEYKKATRRIKRAWVKKHMPQVTEFHAVQYGTPKHRVANNRPAILIDDHALVREAWTLGMTIDATEDIIFPLWNLV